MTTVRLLFVALFLSLAAPPAARADAGTLGTTEFAVSGGSAEARQHFHRGLLALHSFWYEEAEPEMAAAVKADPTFTMGWWGVAMSHSKLLWYDDDVPAARAALSHIGATDPLTPVEREWIGAAKALFGDGNLRERRQAFTAVLERMYRAHPLDDDVATFYALGLLSSMMPGEDDPQQLATVARAAGIALEVFLRNPKHPGAAHYLIHALDTPDLAPIALPAAKVYASIAPDAFHARHMPAHIFSRLGMWDDAIASCRAAWDSSVASAQRAHLGVNARDFHSYNWIFELAMQLGQRRDAEASLKSFGAAVRGGLAYRWRFNYIDEVGSYLRQTEQWQKLDELLKPIAAPVVDERSAHLHEHGKPPAPDLDTPPFADFEQMTLLQVRIGAAAHRHDVATVEKLMKEVDVVMARMRPWQERQMGAAMVAKADAQVALMRKAGRALAHGDPAGQLEALRAVAVEADKQPLGEGQLFDGGVHEEIAETLLQLKRPSEALEEYRAVIRKHPRYGRALLGAARAASQAGDGETARSYASQALEVWARADAGFAPVVEARALAQAQGKAAPKAPAKTGTH